MSVDVTTSIVIHRPIDEVAAFAMDPVNAPRWYANIDSVAVLGDGPWGVGREATFAARFLGRTLTYTYVVREFQPGTRLVMSTSEGPFPMTTTYTFSPDPAGTRMELRNHGEPSGFGRLAAPVMAAAMRRANQADLALLKTTLEAAASPA